MLRKLSQLAMEPKSGIRGGSGWGRSANYLEDGAMEGVAGAGRTELEPGASIGEHPHPDSDELYLILEGHGTGIVDGARFPVSAGDLFLIKAGQSHGLVNDSDQPMAFFGLVTRRAENR